MGEIVDLFAKAVRESGRLQRLNAFDHIGRIHSPEPATIQPCTHCLENHWKIHADETGVFGRCKTDQCLGYFVYAGGDLVRK